jgi:predicted enzyme related to lactoylglutathione lyase
MDTAKAFYHAALGTSSVDMPDGTGYVLMTANNQPVAGMMEFPEEMPPDSPTYWSVYFNVEDADDCAERVVELGGSVVVEPQDSPAGRFAYLSDPQGAQFAIIQPDPNFQM